MVHVYHALRRARLDDCRNLMRALLAYQVGDRFVVDEELIGRYEAAGNTRNEPLAEDARHRGRKLEADLVLLRRREGVDDAVDGLGCVVGVERGENEVAC